MALGRYRYLHAYEPLRPYRHASLVVLALPRRGPVVFEIDGVATVVRPMEVLCIPPGHTYSTGVEMQPRGELFWLILKSSAHAPKDALHRAIGLFAEQDSEAWEAPKEVVAELERAFRIAVEHDDWIADGMLHHVVSSAVLRLARARRQRRPPSGVALAHPHILRALDWIEANLSEPVDAVGLASASGLAPSRFYQVFREATGTTPKDYILRRKIERAVARFTEEPQATVTEVAHELGFSSSQYFATVFRKYQGVSPSHFRPEGQTSAW
jgi:AraC-like DNA-binding protein